MVNEEDDQKPWRKRYRNPLNTKPKLMITLSLIFFVIFLYNNHNKPQRISDDTSYSENDSVPKKQKRKGIVDPGKTVWTIYQDPLVKKSSPRQCSITSLAPQVDDPLIYINKNNGEVWKRRSFTCFPKKCPNFMMKEFESRSFKQIINRKEDLPKLNLDTTFFIVNSNDLEILNLRYEKMFDELFNLREGTNYISSYIEMKDLTKDLVKSYGKQFGCDMNYIFRDQVTLFKPLLLDKKPFLIRSSMLIASSYPFMVFSRLSNAKFLDSKKSFPIYSLQQELAINKITGSHFIDTVVNSAVKKSLLFVFNSIRTKLTRRRGSFHLVDVTFQIDDKFRVYIDEINTNTLENVDNMKSTLATSEMLDLVQELQEVPVAFVSMNKGDKYGSWEMLFSEKQESCEVSKPLFNVCEIFDKERFIEMDLRKANSRVGKVHNVANRMRHEEERVKKKREQHKKDKCRAEKITYPSSRCDKLQEGIDQKKFDKLFGLHEKGFNPYYFKMAKPGEVLPWDKV
eukprot:maker-scaffold_1-snap-gene-6.2-mRNA-1 protein AED:0.00 eAED:0.00 QI:51/1/1/1/1/1/2/41/511